MRIGVIGAGEIGILPTTLVSTRENSTMTNVGDRPLKSCGSNQRPRHESDRDCHNAVDWQGKRLSYP